MEIKGDFFVLLHSESQKSYIVDTMPGMVKKNMDAFIKRRPSDYYVIAMAESTEELEEQKRRLVELRKATL